MTPHYAGFWRRSIAHLIDSVVLNLVTWVIQVAVTWTVYLIWSAWASGKGQPLPPYDDAFNAMGLYIFNAGLYLVISFPYFVAGTLRYGTTLGKRLFHIYVVAAADGQTPITLRQSVLRYAGYLPSYLLFCVGFLMVGFNPKKQGLHDLIASSVSVVRKPGLEARFQDSPGLPADSEEPAILPF